MEEVLIGKTFRDEKDEEYVVLKELTYKGIACVYAMKVREDNEEGEKMFFQLTNDENIKLVNIKSEKMLEALADSLFNQTALDNKPRKINENESIAEYLAYLDEFYKSKVITIM